MLDEHSTRRQRFSTILLTAGVGMGALLCYLIAVPFLPAIVWSFTLAILFAPLDTRIRKAVRARGLAAAATLAIVAGVIVAPAITVIGFLLNEAVGSAPELNAVFDARNWTRAIDNYPRLAPAIHSAIERLNIPDLIQAAAAWLAGWIGYFVQGSIASLISLLLAFYFLFYFLRDREMAIATTGRALPLTEAEFTRLTNRIANTIFASVYDALSQIGRIVTRCARAVAGNREGRIKNKPSLRRSSCLIGSTQMGRRRARGAPPDSFGSFRWHDATMRLHPRYRLETTLQLPTVLTKHARICREGLKRSASLMWDSVFSLHPLMYLAVPMRA